MFLCACALPFVLADVPGPSDTAYPPTLIQAQAQAQGAETQPPESVLLDQLVGGPKKNNLGFSVQGGYPWLSLRVLWGVGHRLAPLFEAETALGRRFTTSLGLSVNLFDARYVRISGEVLLGWLLQDGELGRRGPSGEVRFRAAVKTGRWLPFLVLGSRHAVLPDRTRVEKTSGIETKWSARHEWTPFFTLGLGVAVFPSLGLDVAVDYGWVDAPGAVAIPGAHLGLHFGQRNGEPK